MAINVGVIGTGRLGLCFALLASRAGFTTHISDSNTEYLRSIANSTLQTAEPDVEDLLRQHSLRIHETNHSLAEESDLIFTFVPTPSLENGKYDLMYIDNVISDLRRCKPKQKKLFVIGSTVNPGDTCDIANQLNQHGYEVAYNPEFIAQGSIINDLRHSRLVLIGSDDPQGSYIELLCDVYNRIQSSYITPRISVLSPTVAEIVKLSVNCFLTTKISYANIIGTIIANSGFSDEIPAALAAIGSHPPIGSQYLNFGFGYGGPCLPRDNRALAAYAKQVNVEHSLGAISDLINKNHNLFLASYFESKNVDKLPFFFSTVTYKPGTEIIEESSQLALLETLLIRGNSAIVYDVPDVIEKVFPLLKTRYGELVSLSTSPNPSEPNFPICF